MASPTQSINLIWYPHYKMGVIMVLLMQTWVHPWFILYYFHEEQFDWPITNNFEAWGTPQHRSLFMLPSPNPLSLQIYIHGSWTMTKPYGIKHEVLLGTSQGTHWEETKTKMSKAWMLFLWWAEQRCPSQKKKKIELWGSLQPTNMVQKKN